MARTRNGTPTIVNVEEMPPMTHSRAAADLAPLIVALRDRSPHAIEDVRSDEDRRRWRRKLRRASLREGLKVETRYVGDEARLYFRGIDPE